MQQYILDRREGRGGKVYPYSAQLAAKPGFEVISKAEGQKRLGIEPEPEAVAAPVPEPEPEPEPKTKEPEAKAKEPAKNAQKTSK